MSDQQDIYVQHLRVENIRNIKNLDINVSDSEKKHLILTGKNGSGKTSVLKAIKNYFEQKFALNGNQIYRDTINSIKSYELAIENHYEHIRNSSQIIDIEYAQNEIYRLQELINQLRFGLNDKNLIVKIINESNIYDKYILGNFMFVYFQSSRGSINKEENGLFEESTGPEKINFDNKLDLNPTIGKKFIKHLVNTRNILLEAYYKNNSDKTMEIEKRFKNIEKIFIDLIGKNIEFIANVEDFSFSIHEPGKEPYTLNQLSDGFSAVLSIVTELIMRMESHKTKAYDVQGIVLIDEIETHLHIDLQKKILPFLTNFFPKIQFIVTTHSPFVLSSIEDAVICDLEKKIVAEDFTGYSTNLIVESYFDNDEYSNILKEKILEYEKLLSNNNKDKKMDEELIYLQDYFSKLSVGRSKELKIKLQQLALKYPQG